MNLLLSRRSLLLLSFAAIYLIWGSTYLINYFAIQAIPPFLMSGARFLAAGLILYSIVALRGIARPSWAEWGRATRIGILFLATGTGGTVWAEQYVDTGITALLMAFQPLLIVMLMWLMQGRRPGLLVLAGIALGVIGMAVLVGQQRFVTDEKTLFGMLVIACSMMSWAIASILLPGVALPSDRMQSTAMQMIGGGLCLFLFSLMAGEFRLFQWEQITWKAGLSWVYLVFFGSIIAFSAFTYLLHQVTADKVATANYVNPVVAVFLGWAFNQEPITPQSLLAGALMLLGVFFINSRSGTTAAPGQTPFWQKPFFRLQPARKR